TLTLLSFTTPSPPELHTLSLHDALPICGCGVPVCQAGDMLSAGRTEGTEPRASRLPKTLSRTPPRKLVSRGGVSAGVASSSSRRSEEHTSELQSLAYLVCRLLLEKKKHT